MLEPSISISSENANVTRLPKDAKSNPTKRSKKRSKALSDVKNTLHSHSSSVAEKSKNLVKNPKKDGNLSSIGKGRKSCESKAGFNIFAAENDAENKCHSDFGCTNHFACEKANSFNETESLSEYKLTNEEINYLGDRMRFCQLDPVPMKFNIIEPVEDIEVPDMKRKWFDDDTEDDVFNFEIPEPCFY